MEGGGSEWREVEVSGGRWKGGSGWKGEEEKG